MAPDELTADEIYALANAFSVPSAKALLSMTEFPPWAIPIADYTNSLEFWSKIARHVADGVMRDGRRQILAAARARFPYHAAFAQPSAPGGQSPCEGRPLRVLVIGASPSDLPPVRTDQESRAISKAALADRIAVSYAPAARSTDLEKLRSLRPDIVHFVCHGDEGRLLFNDVHGESNPSRPHASATHSFSTARARMSGSAASCSPRAMEVRWCQRSPAWLRPSLVFRARFPTRAASRSPRSSMDCSTRPMT